MSERCQQQDERLYRMPARERYQHDVEFHHLVDMMRAMIAQSRFSPSEMREAAVLAACMYEERQATRAPVRTPPKTPRVPPEPVEIG